MPAIAECCQVPESLVGKVNNHCPECDTRFDHFAHVCQICDKTVCHSCHQSHKYGRHD